MTFDPPPSPPPSPSPYIHSDSSHPHDHNNGNDLFSSPSSSYSEDLAFHSAANSPSPVPKKLIIQPSQQVNISLYNLN